MTLPDTVRSGVEDALRAAGLGTRVRATRSVGGGCINHGARLDTDASLTFFLKWNASAPLGMFEAEADGLRALRRAAGTDLRVPEPVAHGFTGDDPGTAWLLLEHVAPGPGSPQADERLGRGLAALHRRGAADVGTTLPATSPFGWPRGNWIGSLPQRNGPSASWAELWRDHRVRPQLERAREAGRLVEPLFDHLLDAIPSALGDVGAANLLHGDLWSGNAYADAAGTPTLIDPAVYLGHGEVDIAMTELFGGFGPRFYDAYREAAGLPAAYASHRRALYQLYYLIVHVNLFGASYVAGSRRAAEQVLAAL